MGRFLYTLVDRADIVRPMHSPIDDYLARLDAEPRATLSVLRERILALAPDAEEAISYGAPAFRINGTAIAGFSASRNHLSYLPHSGSVISQLDPSELAGFEYSKGAVKMPVDTPLPLTLIARLIECRRNEAGV